MANVQLRIDAAQEAIEEIVEPLSDDEFLEVMDAIASYCDSCAAAKREEQGK